MEKVYDRHGFSLIELIVVISIIAILMTLVAPMMGKAKQKARIAQTKAEIAALETAISAYYSDRGTYPTDGSEGDGCESDNTDIISQLSGIDYGGSGTYEVAITGQTDWNGPYMEFDTEDIVGGQFVDPWNQAYVMELALDNDFNTPPSHNKLTFDIVSGGPDQSTGSEEDNITNY